MPGHGKTITACAWLALMLLSINALGAESPIPSKGKNQPEQDRNTVSGKRVSEKKATAEGGEAKKELRAEAQTSHVHEPPVGQPGEAKAPDIAPIFDQPGVLTPKGTLVLEPSLQFSNSSSNRVALSGYTIIPSFTIGLIDVRNVNSNTYVAALTTRYGITNRLEFEARVPYVYRSDSTSFEPTTDPNTGNRIPASVFSADGKGLGDVEFGPRFQLNQPGGEGPYLIASLRVKSVTGKDPFEVPTASNVTSPSGVPLQTELPTGSGFWGIQPGISAIFSSDPAVFFGTVSYMWNMERKVEGQGRLDPGDTIGFNFGVGVALNEKSSFSIGYDHIVLGKPKINGTEIPGSIITQVGSLLFGFSYKLTEKTSVNFSIGAGLTPAASNVQLTLRLPTSFLLTGK
ncbi:transporter [Geotalea sp. SG265]|uniref:transporter n=1 Tax=Geotalea sp. SG265 TaxID=2922867 RepID=UPI001FAEA1A9|nr:transporter [Geotalea sp. SG265]